MNPLNPLNSEMSPSGKNKESLQEKKLRLQALDRSSLLHPFTNHSELHAQGTHLIHEAKGVRVTDENGRQLIDGLAGLWCVNVGHGREEIVQAVSAQMMKNAYYPSFFNTTTEPTILLADRLLGLLRRKPTRLAKVFFSGSGSEANESALKIIRAYTKAVGKPKKTKIGTLTFGYHGVSLATTSMTHIPSCQTPFDLPAPQASPGYFSIPSPCGYLTQSTLTPEEYGQKCIAETEAIIEREGADTIAALFVEPVQGAGGVIPPAPGYPKALRELARKHQILYVADEVICAFGRLGEWFGHQLYGTDPDLMTTAKGITSGYLPLGATFVSAEIDAVLSQKGYYFAHGNTYSGHPAACAAALANLEILEREKLIERVREEIGPYFQNKLQEFKAHPAVGEVRGVGLIAGVELLPRGGRAALNPAAPLGPLLAKKIREEGVIVRGIRDLIAIAPPLTITKKEVDEMLVAVARGLDSLK